MSKKSRKRAKRKACIRAQEEQKKAEKSVLPEIRYGVRATWLPGQDKIYLPEFEESALVIQIDIGKWYLNFVPTVHKRSEVVPMAEYLLNKYGNDRDIQIRKSDYSDLWNPRQTEYSLEEFLSYRDL